MIKLPKNRDHIKKEVHANMEEGVACRGPEHSGHTAETVIHDPI